MHIPGKRGRKQTCPREGREGNRETALEKEEKFSKEPRQGKKNLWSMLRKRFFLFLDPRKIIGAGSVKGEGKLRERGKKG